MNQPSSEILAAILLETGTEPDEMLDFVSHGLAETDPLMGMDKVTHGADGRRIGITTYNGKNYTMTMTVDLQPMSGDRWGFSVNTVFDPHKILSMIGNGSSFWEIKRSEHMNLVNQVVLQIQRDAKRLADEMPVIRYDADRKIIAGPIDSIFMNLDDQLYNVT